MAPDLLVPSPVSSPFFYTDFPLFDASRSKNRGRALIPSKPEDLAKSVNPVSPPSSTLQEPLIASPKEQPIPSRPSPHSPSNLSSPLFPTFHSAHVLSMLAEGDEGPLKTNSGPPMVVSVTTGSGLGTAGSSSPPSQEVHCSAMDEPMSVGADQNVVLELTAEADSGLSVMAMKCPITDSRAEPKRCGSVRANEIASLVLGSSPDSLDSAAPIENPPVYPGQRWSKKIPVEMKQ